MELLKLLENPGREFTAIPFWFLNDAMSPEELRRQLQDFSDHGVYGVVLHPRIGLPEELGYLTDEWFRMIRAAVEAAAELNMSVVLYDEGMYPSGSANGKVVEGHPELASQGLLLVQQTEPEDEILAVTEKGTLVARKSRGTIRGIHFGQDDGEPNAPASADILNPEAVARFMELTHEAYYRVLKEYFGNTIIGFFTDEPSILGRGGIPGMKAWTRGFAEIFTAAGGDLKGLTGLFDGTENRDTALYQKMIVERENETYYLTLSRWCEDHGIGLMGHPHSSDDIEIQQYFHVPGQDLVLRRLAPETGGLVGKDSTMGKCSADAARILGCRRNSNECFGACNREDNPWYFTGGDMKWYLDWLAVRGVNLFIPHAFYYSIAGKRKEERPPDVGPNSIWWPYYRQWAMYIQRLSCLMTDAQLHADVAVLCGNRDLKQDLVATLFEKQIGFQYLPGSVWDSCREENGKLIWKDYSYSVVLDDKGRFPGVSGDLDAVEPDCVCAKAQPMLRVMRFMRAGKECWFLVNEGDTPIRTEALLPTAEALGWYDLWSGEKGRCESTEEKGKRRIPLNLGRWESRLVFTCTEEELEQLPNQKPDALTVTPEFTLEREEPETVRKIYTARLTADEAMIQAGVTVQVEAEEMAELYVNGKLAGAGFWQPQRFRVSRLLYPGENSLELTVTGNLANKYGNKAVWYGLYD